jgi:hypothetical protein
MYKLSLYILKLIKIYNQNCELCYIIGRGGLNNVPDQAEGEISK